MSAKKPAPATDQPLQPVAHADVSPSSAYRWSRCPRSVGFIEENRHVLPKDSSVYADQGTKAALLAAEVLTGKRRIIDSDDVDMLINVRAYVEFFRDQVKVGDLQHIEKPVNLFYNPSKRGTPDARLEGRERYAVTDLKYGQGVSVYAKDNEQLAIYAESAIRELETVVEVPDSFKVELYIFQPRDRNDENPIREWKLTRDELRQFTEPLGKTAQAIMADRNYGDFKAGEKQCKFCPASGICKAYAAYALEVVTDAPIDAVAASPTITLPSPDKLTRQQRVNLLKLKPGLEKFLAAVEEQELAELESGAEPIAFKLVEGRSHRKWRDEGAAIVLLSQVADVEKVAPRTPLSPAQAEKFLKAVEVSDDFQSKLTGLIEKPPGKRTLAPVEDRRPAIEMNPTRMLENVDVI